MTLKPLNNTDREIRVFISSTFRDMHAERDYLVSHVFPVIRRACRERQVEFTEIDLRWGVTKEDAEQGKVVRICLEEINRCRPYFLSLLGERYGWAPVDTDLEHKAELFALFPFLEKSLKAGLSVTEMEILHGVLDNPEMTEHCFFYLRDKALSHSLAASLSAPQDYFETDQRLQAKLDDLKHQVRSSGLPVRDNYASIEALAELIKQDLLAVLDTQFPEDQTPTPLIAEQNAHRCYARERCQAYIANPRDIEALDKHLNTLTNHALLITGESGLGKSALLAYWLNQQRLLKPEQFIIEHYVGISGDADPVAIIRRIMAEIKHRNHDSEDLPSKPEEIIRDFPLWLAKISERDPLLLIIDGLNQLENKAGLWLPSFWQENVKAIFSVIPGEQLEALSQRDWPVHSLEALDIKRRVQLIGDWLANYRKALASEQTQLIAKAPQTGNPLFLKTLLEELRIFGYFEQLDQRISTLLSANNPQELFILVLARLENDFGKDIVTQIMQALWAARRGLSETEIAGITGLSRLVISTFLMAIDAHLAKRGGLLSFFHDYLRQAVKLHGLESKETEINVHIKLAQYFEQQELNDRVAEELPWQWQQAEQWEALKDCISAIPMFEILYDKDDLELLAYWLALGDRFDAGECYQVCLEKLSNLNYTEKKLGDILISLVIFLGLNLSKYSIAESFSRRAIDIFEETNDGRISVALNNYAVILSHMGRNEEAIDVNYRALELKKNQLGDNHPDVGSTLNNLGSLYITMGRLEDAESLLRKAIQIEEQVLDLNHPNTAATFGSLGCCLLELGKYEESSYFLKKALEIVEYNFGSNHPLIGTCIGNLAHLADEQKMYVDAEFLYRKSLKLRANIFGNNHIDTAIGLFNLSAFLFKVGNYEEAESFGRFSLSICENLLNSDHNLIIKNLHNLALILNNRGEIKEAEKFFIRTINIFKLYDDSLEKAVLLGNFARIKIDQNLYEEAEVLLREVVLINEKLLGITHLDTIGNQELLGALFESLGKLPDAIQIYKAIFTSLISLNKQNSDRAIRICDHLGMCLWGVDKIKEALDVFNQQLEILTIYKGRNNIETIEKLQTLANLCRNTERYDEAESLYREVIKLRETNFSDKEIEIAGTFSGLGLLLVKTNRIDEAILLYNSALVIREKVLGPEHPQTILVRERLGEITSS